jgi:uridine kinase
MQQILREHRARYPLMEPQDAVKLIYQRAFGPGHLIKTRASALEALAAEASHVQKDPGAALFEPLGAGLARLNLSAEGLPSLGTVAGMFFATAARAPRTDFQGELDALCAVWPECAPFVALYRSQNCPPISHSAAYRAAYRPSYRLVLCQFARFFALFEAIDALRKAQKRVLIAIEGRCASGKTSLSALIEAVYGATVLHMDDFFLSEAQKAAGVKAPVANIDGERLLAALGPLTRGEPFEYRRYDCQKGKYLPPKTITPADVLVVEGVYCLHPALRQPYDLSVFMTVDPQTQRQRLAARNPDLFDKFRTLWIPQEENYIAAFNVQEGCMVLDGADLERCP